MGWFWDTKPDANAGDATRNLDPSLKDFLNKQTPSQHGEASTTSASSRQQAAPPPTERTTQITQNARNPQNATTTQTEPSTVPSESLFPDGRYAHLWKNYETESGVRAKSQTNQGKIVDVLETIKDRKAAIGRAALENCVEEQMAERECYRSGAWKDRLLMCREQNRAFSRCYSMQSRFLRALGYLSSEHTSAADEEKIQMHADKLYHEMLERERVMEEARSTAGEEAVPVEVLQHQPVIPTESTTRALGEESAWARARRKAQMDGSPVHLADFPPEKQAEVKERLSKLTPAEREVELQLMAAETRAMREYTEQIDRELREEKQRREERRGAGKETVGDSLKRLWGYGDR